MPVQGVRVTYFFFLPPGGFSETHVNVNATSIPGVAPLALSLLKKRMLLMGPPASFDFCRISVEGVFRDSAIYNANNPGWNVPAPTSVSMPSSGGIPTEPSDSDQIKSSLLLRLEATSLHRSMKFLCAIPDPIIGTDPILGRPALYSTWYKAFNNWSNELLANGWGEIYRTNPAGAFAKVQIMSLTTDGASGNVGLIVPNNVITFTAGQEVQVSGSKRTNRAYLSLNGKWTVYNVQNNTPVAGQNTYLLFASSDVPIGQITFPGFVQVVDYSAYAYTNVQAMGNTTRKRGGRFTLPVGRRSIKKFISA